MQIPQRWPYYIRETNAKNCTQIKYMQRAWILVTSRMEADNDLFQFSRNHQRSEEPIFRWRGKKHWFKIKSFGGNLQFTFKEQARFHEDFNHCYKDKVKSNTRFIWTENTIIAWTVEIAKTVAFIMCYTWCGLWLISSILCLFPRTTLS